MVVRWADVWCVAVTLATILVAQVVATTSMDNTTLTVSVVFVRIALVLTVTNLLILNIEMPNLAISSQI